MDIPKEILNYRIPINMPIESLYEEYFTGNMHLKNVFVSKYISEIRKYKKEFLKILKERELIDEYFIGLNIPKKFEETYYAEDIYYLIEKFPELLLPVFFIDKNDLIERSYKIQEELEEISEVVSKEEYSNIFLEELKYDLTYIYKIRRNVNVS